MQDPTNATPQTSRREPWNKGKLIGAKPPLRPKHVWSIRTKLQIGGRIRDLAMFNLAIDSKLRGCDVVSLRVEDVAPHGCAVDRATVRQKKTGQPVKFEVTEQTREAIDNYIAAAKKKPGEFLFGGSTYHDATVCPTGWPMDCRHWSGSEVLRDALAAPNQSDPHLPPDWQPAGGSASVGAQED
jgi:integrase